ncbi:hypothetical protein GF366_02000 [Candidatus Peregrinibacteria bacterium]|nr:hypothetical protein [Candidatus Peregrinibacteria bacterium]
MKKHKVKIPGKIIKIPYLTIKGKEKGKTCVISGGVHGNEINGIALVKKILEHCKKNKIEKRLIGELIIFPILNNSGFERHKRFVHYDNKDLNRSYNRNTTTASNLIANSLEKQFYSKADIAIDCHDSGKRSILLPHTRIHKFEDNYCTTCTREMAKAFGSKIIVERKGKKGMLAIEMTKKYKLPVLTVEVGGALEIKEKYINQSLDGIINILISQGFIPGEVKIPKKQYYLQDRFGIPAKEAGIVMFEKKLGQRVHLGDKIGKIYVPSKGKTKDLYSPMCGLIFSLQHVDSVIKGEIMYSILEDKKCHRKRRTTTDKFEEIININM